MQADKNLVKHYIHVAVFLLITFGVGFLPSFAQITEGGMKVLGVFLGIIYGWLFLGLAWPSIFALVALGLSGYKEGLTIDGLFISGFSFQILPQLILSYLFADAIAQTKFTKYISNKFLSIKMISGKPFMLIFILLVASVVMVRLGCALAGLFLLWSLCKEIANAAGYPERSAFCTYMVMGTTVGYVWSTLIMPFSPSSLMCIQFLKQGIPEAEVPFVGWILFWLLFSFLYCALYTLIIKYIARPDLSAIASLGNVAERLGADSSMKMTKDQKFGLAMLLSFITLMFAGQLLPAELAITVLLKKMGLTGTLVLVLCIMCAYEPESGKPFLSLQRSANVISWDVIWLLVATEPIATAFNSAEAGIMASITAVIIPILTNMSSAMFLIVCTVVLGLVTQVVHNFVLMVVFIPFLCPIYAQMGGNPLLMFIALVVAMYAAFSTPAASWSSALVFGNETVIKEKTYLWGFINFALSVTLALVLLLTVGEFFF